MKATPIMTRRKVTVATLLRKVRELVLAEPKRLDMRDWVRHYRNSHAEPACGTVGCVAGWCAILLREPGDDAQELNHHAAEGIARRIGLVATPHGGYERVGADIPTSLFSARPQALEFGERPAGYDEMETPILGGKPGSVRHARAVARRISTFLRQHPELETRLVDGREGK